MGGYLTEVNELKETDVTEVKEVFETAVVKNPSTATRLEIAHCCKVRATACVPVWLSLSAPPKVTVSQTNP